MLIGRRELNHFLMFFKEESESLFEENNMDKVFDCSQGHPIVLKKFLGGNIVP